MNTTYPASAAAPQVVVGDFSFSPNATSDPATTYFGGSLANCVTSVTYSATGKYTIVFKPRFVFPSASTPVFVVGEQLENLTNQFAAVQVGAYVPSTRTLVVQAHRVGTGYAVPASTGAAKISIHVHVANTTVK